MMSFVSGEQPPTGSEEETQGLLGKATEGLQNVAKRASGQYAAAMEMAVISRERWMAFFVLLAFGALLMAAAFASLPLILIAPHKFAGVFTLGSLCILSSFASLKGFSAFGAHLMSSERLPLSAAYIGSIGATLWASMWYRSTLLTMGFSGVQILALLWFFVAYIPGGTMVLRYVQDAVCQGCGSCCCGMCVKPGSIPL